MKKEKTTLTKPQKALLETVIEELKKGVVPWQKPWHALGSPQNAKSGHEYRGENHFYLSLIMMENGFSDPRFLTFAQMLDHNKGLPREEQLSLPKGTTGFPISYASYYSKELKRNLSGADFKIWSQEEIQKKFAEGEIYYFQKTATVFNLEQFEGSFPSLQLEKSDIQVDLDLVKGVAEKMKLSFILEKNGNRAYYSPLKDEVCIPSEESFHEEIGFYTTVFHEFAHATSHPTRLDREIKGRGDLKAYAVEELRAEISSLFLSQKIDLPLSEKDVAQGASYIGNWLEVLENDPQVLFEGAKDAGKISAYLFDHVKSYEVEIKPKYESKMEKEKEASLSSKNLMAVKVGTEFILTDEKTVSNINLVQTESSVEVEGQSYNLFSGSTFEESQKVDAFIDVDGHTSYKLSDYELEDEFEM